MATSVRKFPVGTLVNVGRLEGRVVGYNLTKEGTVYRVLIGENERVVKATDMKLVKGKPRGKNKITGYN